RSTSGSSRISTPKKAARPATTISVLMTKARIGRRTKSAVMPCSSPPLRISVITASGRQVPTLGAAADCAGYAWLRARNQQFGSFTHGMDALGNDHLADVDLRIDKDGLGIALDDTNRR